MVQWSRRIRTHTRQARDTTSTLAHINGRDENDHFTNKHVKQKRVCQQHLMRQYLSQKLSFTVRSSSLRVHHHLRELRLNVLGFTPVRFGGWLSRLRTVRGRLEQIRIHHFTGKTLRCGKTSSIHSLIETLRPGNSPLYQSYNVPSEIL